MSKYAVHSTMALIFGERPPSFLLSPCYSKLNHQTNKRPLNKRFLAFPTFSFSLVLWWIKANNPAPRSLTLSTPFSISWHPIPIKLKTYRIFSKWLTPLLLVNSNFFFSDFQNKSQSRSVSPRSTHSCILLY